MSFQPFALDSPLIQDFSFIDYCHSCLHKYNPDTCACAGDIVILFAFGQRGDLPQGFILSQNSDEPRLQHDFSAIGSCSQFNEVLDRNKLSSAEARLPLYKSAFIPCPLLSSGIYSWCQQCQHENDGYFPPLPLKLHCSRMPHPAAYS